MIGFDGVIGVLLGDVARGGYQLLDHSWVGCCPVGGHFSGLGAVLEDVGEEPAGGCQIPLRGDQHVDDLAVLSIARYRYILWGSNMGSWA
jgi:hypothetical protein